LKDNSLRRNYSVPRRYFRLKFVLGIIARVSHPSGSRRCVEFPTRPWSNRTPEISFYDTYVSGRSRRRSLMGNLSRYSDRRSGETSASAENQEPGKKWCCPGSLASPSIE